MQLNRADAQVSILILHTWRAGAALRSQACSYYVPKARMCNLGCLLPLQAEARGDTAPELCREVVAYLGCFCRLLSFWSKASQ